MCNGKYFLIALLCSFFRVSAQQLQNQDAVSVSLSGADIACGESLLLPNPAQVHKHRETLLILNLSNRYMLSELSTSSLAGVWSREKDTFSGAVFYFGSRALNEMLISVGYGRRINHWLDAGIRMNYWQRNIEVYNAPQQTVTGEAGIQVHLSRQLRLGAHVINPTSTTYPGSEEDLKQNLKIGLAYGLRNEFQLGMQVALIDFHIPEFSMGISYHLVESLVLRCGVKIGDFLSWSFGLGAEKGRVQMNLGIGQHAVLGLSAACTLSCRIRGE